MIKFISKWYQSIKDSIHASCQDGHWGMLTIKIVVMLSIAGCSLYIIGTVATPLWMNLEHIIVTAKAFFETVLILRGFWDGIFSRKEEPDASEEASKDMEDILVEGCPSQSLPWMK